MLPQERRDGSRVEQVGEETVGPENRPAISRREMVGALGRAGALLLAAPAYFASRSHAEPILRVGASHPEHDRELRDVFVEGGFVVPQGKVWKVGPNVRTDGNVLVHGQLVMRPGAGLKFEGVDPDRFVGGGHGFSAAVQHDIGLWVDRQGVLDLRGTPKTGWNRTGSDPTWRANDEYYIAPTETGHYTPYHWRPGQPIPRVHPRVPPAEVANVTRDVVIEGPGHIHIRSHRPQRIEYVQLRNLGVSNRAADGPVEGRYALHLHHGGRGTEGTLIRGVAAVDSRGRVFVTHSSHGITLEDNVSVNSWFAGLWWDPRDETHGLTVDRLLVLGMAPPYGLGNTFAGVAVALSEGNGNAIRNSVVTGMQTRRSSERLSAYLWPRNTRNNALWAFEGNVAHNNSGAGVKFYVNDSLPHELRGTVVYRNRRPGIDHGRYNDAVQYFDTVVVDDQVLIRSASRRRERIRGPNEQGQRFERLEVYNRQGPAVEVTQLLQRNSQVSAEFVDCTFVAGPGAPKIRLPEKVNFPWVATFRRCGISPDDIEIPRPIAPRLAGSIIVIEGENGGGWEITLDVQRQRKVVRELASLAHRTS